MAKFIVLIGKRQLPRPSFSSFCAPCDIHQGSTASQHRQGKPISPIALEAVRRLDALFEIERVINGRSADERHAVRPEKSKPLLDEMHAWLLRERDTLSRLRRGADAVNYLLRRWADFARFIDDGRICLSNNAAERGLRGIALGRRSWTFAGSQRGADRAAVMLTLITTARLNDVDPKAWLADVLARTAEATGNAAAVAEVLSPYVDRVVIANPKQVHMIAHAKVKTDTIDATVLAKLYASDFLPEVWVPDPETLALRRQVTRRPQLVRQRSRLKNLIQSILHAHLIPPCPHGNLVGIRGRKWLAKQMLPADERAAIERHLSLIDQINEALTVCAEAPSSSAHAARCKSAAASHRAAAQPQ